DEIISAICFNDRLIMNILLFMSLNSGFCLVLVLSFPKRSLPLFYFLKTNGHGKTSAVSPIFRK
ncbi:MAG: hypothetical protein ACJ8MO_31960, partial [Bacillus sp. (in: firmicutes)]